MKRIALALLAALTFALPNALPSASACSMENWPPELIEEYFNNFPPFVPTPTPTPTDPTTTPPTTTPPVIVTPPPPPVFADAPPILFETQGGREEPQPADTVVQWVEESCVLS